MSEPGPLAQQPQDHALLPLPQGQQLWTPRFILLCALTALLGAAATIFGVAGRPIGGVGSGPYNALVAEILSSGQAALVMSAVLIVVCLAGLWLARSALLRAGFLLRAVVVAGAILLSPALWILVGYNSFLLVASLLFSLPFMSLFNLTLGVLGTLSQISLSYGLARWQRSDNIFIWLQILVTLGIGVLIVKDVHLPAVLGSAYLIWIYSGPFLALAGIVCLLLRPACWKVSPLIVLCLTAGGAASLLFGAFFFRLFAPPDAVFNIQQASAVVGDIGNTLFILGLLLLIRRARGQQQAQNSSSLALSGQ